MNKSKLELIRMNTLEKCGKKFDKYVLNSDKEIRFTLKNIDLIDPLNVEEYIARDGYFALEKVLSTMSRKELVEGVKQSGLRGRSGSGFPTGVKWGYLLNCKKETYVICNADEGIPGDFMDRILIEKDPHSVIEGLMICGYATNSKKGYIYLRDEYKNAKKIIEHALDQAYEYGILGQKIFDSEFIFDIELRIGAGAYVCGEETALIESIEGHRGEPRNKPPYPTVKGLFERPTVVNNVETLATIPPIIMNGSDYYASLGTKESPGTNVFTVSGCIKKPGIYELPMGTTLREIIFDVCGGPSNKKIIGAFTGGPGGGIITEENFDVPLGFDSCEKINTFLGGGGVIVIDEDTDIIELMHFFLEFALEESCGKCTPCREGTKRMIELIDKFREHRATEKDLNKLIEFCHVLRDASLCGLGISTPTPILSTLEYLGEKYKERIIEDMGEIKIW